MHRRRNAEQTAVLVLGLDNFKFRQRHARPRHRRQAAARRRQAPRSTLPDQEPGARLNSGRVRDRADGEDAALMEAGACWRSGYWTRSAGSLPARRPLHRHRRHHRVLRWRPRRRRRSEKLLKRTPTWRCRAPRANARQLQLFESGMDAHAQSRRDNLRSICATPSRTTGCGHITSR